MLEENKKKLCSILETVEQLAQSKDMRDQRTVFYIVKILTDYINTNRNIIILENRETYNLEEEILFSINKRVYIDKTYIIKLGKMPIITNIWNKKD